MSKISERFSEAINIKKLNNAFIAKKYNISRQLVNNFFTNQKTLTDMFATVCNGEEINLNWLLTGEGEMFISKVNKLVTSDSYSIDLLSAKNYIIEKIDTILIDKKIFKIPINVDKIKGIQISGDSMEPTLKDGDYVLIDEDINLGTDGIYAIQYDRQILIKRLQFKLDGTISIISDNTKYQIETFKPTETKLPFQILGIKILSIQR